MTPVSAAKPSGAVLILGATVIAGVAGYLVTWVVYRTVGTAPYATFAVYRAALYLVIGGLSGIQQEITRATRVIEPGSRTRPSRARNFGLIAAGGVVVAIVGSSPLWSMQVFPEHGWALVWPLACGAGSYVLVAVLSGSLYGIAQWRSVALLIACDGVSRLALALVALAVTQDVVVLAWAVAIPFPLAIVVLWPFIRAGLVGRSDIDVRYRGLIWNVSRTVLASVSMAILVSGFPLLLALTSSAQSPALIGEIIFTITLTRAPLVVVAMALQSYLLVRFRDDAVDPLRLFFTILGGILGVATLLGVLGWWLGPAVFGILSADPVQVDGPFIAVLVVSAALVAALCVSAPAVLARSEHFVYSLGWAVAALVTVAIMITPMDFMTRLIVALLCGPVAGLVVHVGWLVLAARRPAAGSLPPG